MFGARMGIFFIIFSISIGSHVHLAVTCNQTSLKRFLNSAQNVAPHNLRARGAWPSSVLTVAPDSQVGFIHCITSGKHYTGKFCIYRKIILLPGFAKADLQGQHVPSVCCHFVTSSKRTSCLTLMIRF